MRQTKKMIDLHQYALQEFDRIQKGLYQERKLALEDRRFYSISGAQWEGELSEQYQNKPQFEVNKVQLALIKIFNEYRNNRITVDFVSKDGTPNTKLADICDSLFRADELDSSAEEAYDNAFEEATGGGFGAVRLTTKYEDPEDPEDDRQRIYIEPIYDADSSVFFDLDAKKQDKSDAKCCFVIYSMTHEGYVEEWGKDPQSIWKDISDVEYDWYTPDFVYIAEFYYVEMKKTTVHVYATLAGNEEKYTDEDFENDPELEEFLESVGTRKVREKKIEEQKVHKYIMDGNEFLEDCGYLAGKYLPIIPTYGKRWFIDGIERCMGHVRLVKDVQRLKNMLVSQLAEIASTSPTKRPIFLAEQMAGHAQEWADANLNQIPYYLIEPVLDPEGNIVISSPVSYLEPPDVPQALAALMQLVDLDQKEILGGSAETDKMLSHVSGKAHELIQKRIDGQAFIYMSNFAKCVKRIGEVWLSMARDVYVEPGRNMKAIDPTGEVMSIQLEEPGLTETETPGIVNDLSKATFDVAVDVGPSSASQREATVQTLLGMLQVVQDPETQQVIQSMILMNMEGDGISETRDFFRKRLVQMGVLPPTPEEAQAMAQAQAQPSPQDQALIAMAAEANAKAQKAMAEVQKVVSEIQLNAAKTAETYSEVDTANLNRALNYIEAEQRQLQIEQQQLAARQMQQPGLPPR